MQTELKNNEVIIPQRIEKKELAIVEPTELSLEKLKPETILKYIAPKATIQEAVMFLALCRKRNLDPFAKEVYLIKYSESQPASMVISKDGMLKRASLHPDYEGLKAGIIVKKGEERIVREGSIIEKGEVLIGGWAVVRRKNQMPFRSEVSLEEYNKAGLGGVYNMWVKMPATMIRKVAIGQAIREAFPDEFSGLVLDEREQLPPSEQDKVDAKEFM